jgi:hypothetical protein
MTESMEGKKGRGGKKKERKRNREWEGRGRRGMTRISVRLFWT